MESAGYTRVIERYGVETARLHHSSWIDARRSTRDTTRDALGVEELFPARYQPQDSDYDQLLFALKYDGLDLAALARIFARLDRTELTRRIAAQPRSKYARRIFFLFERLTGETLELADLTGSAYTELLEPDRYYTASGIRAPRYRILDNLLGELGGFCPVVRRTPILDELAVRALDVRARDITRSIDPALLTRAIHYLHAKETRSSYAIEREEPGNREERFIAQLARVGELDLSSEAGLTELQHAIVEPPYRDPGFRSAGSLEVYVSETIGFNRERIHHIGARSASTPTLMEAWARMRPVEGPGAAVVEAACRAFAFVFIHPFGDGNGRVHRLLFHHVLARRGYLPGSLIVPISSAIHADMQRYDQVLEDFSRRVLPMIEHRVDETGALEVRNDPDDFYRYPDLTLQSEATFEWLERAIERDLVLEIDFLQRHDRARAQMRRIVDMPDRKAKLFLVLCLGNHGKLSKRKRKEFAELADETVARLEQVVADAFEGYEGPLD